METNRTLRLTGWRGGTTGFHVGVDSCRRVLLPRKHTMQRVHIELPDHAPVLCNVTSSFWKKSRPCREFRNAEIGRWMITRGDMAKCGEPWDQEKPPRYEAELVREDRDTVMIRVLKRIA